MWSRSPGHCRRRQRRRAARGVEHGHWRMGTGDIWIDFVRSLTRLGSRSVKLAVSDAHEDLERAPGCISQTLPSPLLERPSAASSPPGLAPPSPEPVFRPPARRGAGSPAPHEGAETGRPDGRRQGRRAACMDFPRERRANAGGVFPDEGATARLIGAMLREQADERAVQRAQCMTLRTIGGASSHLIIRLPAVAARSGGPAGTEPSLTHHLMGHDALQCGNAARRRRCNVDAPCGRKRLAGSPAVSLSECVNQTYRAQSVRWKRDDFPVNRG